MEMQAVHVPNMNNPSKSFPKAVFMAVIIILVVFIFGTLAIGFVIPQKEINLLASLLVAYNNLFASIHCEWLGHVIALFLTFGVIGQVSCVIIAPSSGILSVGKVGYLPRGLRKTNKNNVQTSILWVQGIMVSILSLVLVVLPSVQSAYQILSGCRPSSIRQWSSSSISHSCVSARRSPTSNAASASPAATSGNGSSRA